MKDRLKPIYTMVYALVSGILPCQKGSILAGVILTIVTIVVLGVLLPAFWPMLTGSITDINAINGTDAATTFLKTGWPIAILVIGIGIVVALIYFALRQFGVLGGNRSKGI